MDRDCVYCERPIEGRVETFAGEPLHPECLEQLGEELNAAYPLDREAA